MTILPMSMVILTCLLLLLPLLFLLSRRYSPSRLPRKRSVTIIVLGDIGRSPRMMYHAESWAREGWVVRLVGYPGSTPIPSLLTMPLVTIQHISEPPTLLLSSFPFILIAPIKIIWQIISLMHALVFVNIGSEFIMVQNPPSIPTLAIAQLGAHLKGSKLIIDWHNLGYSILAMKVGEGGWVVKLAKWFEKTFGKHAFAHLFVTRAMKEYLMKEWDLQGIKMVLHDRPPPHFKRSGVIDIHELYHRLGPKLIPPIPKGFTPKSDVSFATSMFTEVLGPNSLPVRSVDRPSLLVSSTSWTADEDFSVLVKALDDYEAATIPADSRLPRLVVLISGKGPLRSAFESIVSSRESQGRWKRILVRCIWLKIQDYPTFLGSADLGVSLHQSSSGLDLPMKVVDMFGCGVPVLARDFACLHELVKDGKNGKVFSTADQLSQQLQTLLRDFPNSIPLEKLRSHFPDDRTPDSPGGHGSSSRRRSRAKRIHIGNVDDEISDDEAFEVNSWETHWKKIMAPVVAAGR